MAAQLAAIFFMAAASGFERKRWGLPRLERSDCAESSFAFWPAPDSLRESGSCDLYGLFYTGADSEKRSLRLMTWRI
jgi:hypothetical protein